MAHEELAVRLDETVAGQIKAMAQAESRSESDIVSRLVEEGVRMQRHPGIIFMTRASGRCARLAGQRLAVWEIIALWRAYGEDTAATAQHLDIPPSQVETALRYYREFPDEIEARIAQNERPIEDLIRQYPFVQVHTVTTSENE